MLMLTPVEERFSCPTDSPSTQQWESSRNVSCDNVILIPSAPTRMHFIAGLNGSMLELGCSKCNQKRAFKSPYNVIDMAVIFQQPLI